MYKQRKQIFHPATYLIFLILGSLNARASHAPSQTSTVEAATLDYPPYEYMEDGEAKGIAVDIIKEAALRSGLKDIRFNFYPWKRAVYLTQSGQSDILFNAGKNEERQQWGEYVDSTLILQKYVLFKRKASDIKVNPDFSNVSDKSIAIRLGYLYGSGPFRQALDNKKFKYNLYSYSTKQSVDMLLAYRVDVFVGDYLPVMHYIKKHQLEDEIEVVKEPESDSDMIVLTWPTYILFSKKSANRGYIDKINTAMEEMKKDGTYERIFDSYR